MKVATVGTGYFSQFHYDAWHRCPEVDVVGVADLDLVKAGAVAAEFGAPAFDDVAVMMDQTLPDLLDIISPPQTHLSLIIRAAERGVDVICQKPFCGDLKTAQQAVQAAQSAGIKLIVHENFRFQPWYREIKKQLDHNRLGDIYRITFRLRPGDGQGVEAYLERQPYFQSMKRFLIHETVVHFVDVFRYLMGNVQTVWADIERLNPAIAGEDSCLVVLEFGGKIRGTIDGNRLSDHRAENTRRTMGEMLIEGSLGGLSLNGDGELSFRAHGQQQEEIIQFDWNDHGFGGDCVYQFTRHVVEHFTNEHPLENSGADYLSNLEIEEAIYRSAETGKKLHAPTFKS